MTKHEYKDYQDSVNRFFTIQGIGHLSQIYDSDGDCEPFFSSIPCECCNRHLGGDRYDCNSYNSATKEILDFTVCTDCVYYAEYGQLDDSIMSDLEEEI